MASKPNGIPQISLADEVLSSQISLPPDPCLSYVRFIPATTSSVKPHQSIELARRQILSRNGSATLLHSLLSSINIGTSSFLYIFSVSSQNNVGDASSTLATLQFDGLIAAETSHFALKDLYPCSPHCSLLIKPCSACQDNHPRKQGSHCSLLPRKQLRLVYSHFLEAIRIRLLDDIAQASSQDPSIRHTRPVKRLKGGFLLSSPTSTNEWSASWEYRSLSRPLLYCQLQVHLTNPPGNVDQTLVVHPLIFPTHFLPLAYVSHLHPGAPITLLPHGTPAFFLTHYSGPTSGLTNQFRESLQGLGVSGWETPSAPPSATGLNQSGTSTNSQFIIAWIHVENKQGEDKGIVLIYPTTLCLSFSQSVSFGFPPRLPLDYIPELPAQLQPSPHVPAAVAPALLKSDMSPITAGNHPPSIPSSPSTGTFPYIIPPDPQPRPVLPGSPTSDSIRAFRALTLSKSKGIRTVASEVASYVDTIARLREVERERLKRERENGISNSPKLARTTTTTPAAASTPTPTVTTDVSAPLLTTSLTIAIQPTAASIQPQPPPSQQQPTAAQNFYPSPPQVNVPIVPPHAGQTSPATETPISLPTVTSTATLDTASSMPTPVPAPGVIPVPTQPTSTAFDPFGSGDASWVIHPQPYLNMNIDMDFEMGMEGMDFSLNTDSRGDAFGGDGSAGMDFDDSAFTDDDFSFFDRPSAPTRGLAIVPPPVSVLCTSVVPTVGQSNSGVSVLTPAAAQTPLSIGSASPLFTGDIHLSGPGPLQQTATPYSNPYHSSSPWISSTLGEGFTPRFTGDIDPNAHPPDLLPPSPGPTPSSHSGPATPTVHLESDPVIRRPITGPSIFDPIPFAAYHRNLDGKYAVGKFSLPSPPDEEDRTEPLNIPWSRLGTPFFPKPPSKKGTGSTVGDNNDGWRLKYMAATDPRIGVVRKLIGVKRKLTFEQGGREIGSLGDSPKMSPSWIREHEDWEKNTCINNDDDAKSEADSDNDMDETRAESESPIISRPTTPPPAYLPLGPTLLHTQFHHSELLSLSAPLRQPGAAVAPTNINTASLIASVPTPVSPAATLGASSEKSKSLEAAAFTVAIEVVENPPWAEAWRASTFAGSRQPTEVWLADVRSVVHLFKAIPTLDGPLDLGTLFGFTPSPEPTPTKADSSNALKKPLQILEAPLISIGKGDAVVQILPTALRFWEKLGLGPRGGKKNGTTFVFFEGEQKLLQVEAWLATVAATYEGKHLGTLVPGKNPSCPCDGLFPLRFDSSFRKTLASFVANLPVSQSSLIFFIVTPIPTMTLASPILRQVFSAVKKAVKTYSEAQIHFQLVPEQLIHSNLGNPAANFSDLEVLCASIYNRLLVPVDRVMSRRFFEHGERIRKYFQEPALTLARPIHNKASFTHTPHASLDVMDHHTFLHVGYQISPCGKWILAACVDQRGEAHDLGVWLTQTPNEGESDEVSEEVFCVNKVWEFAIQFAKKANVEWRMVFSRLGVMTEGELDAWVGLVDKKLQGMCMSSFTLLSVESAAPWIFCSSRPQLKSPQKTPPTKVPNPSRSASSPKAHSQTIYTDISNTIYASYPYDTLPQSTPPSFTDLGLSLSLIPEPHFPPPANGQDQQSQLTSSALLPHPIPLLPRSTTTLVCLPTNPSPTAITMLHIHLLHTIRTPGPPISQEDLPSLHNAITRNFHELAILAGARWRLGVSPMLPFHLAAVEAMRIALDCDQHGLDAVDGA